MKLPDTVVVNHKDIKILTPNGYQPFLGVNKIKRDNYIHLTFVILLKADTYILF